MKGVKINCIANSIFPPGTTIVFARLMKLLWIMFSRYWKSIPFGFGETITTIDSSAVGMSAR